MDMPGVHRVVFSTAGGAALFGPLAAKCDEAAMAIFCAKQDGAKLNREHTTEKFPATEGNLTAANIQRLALVNGFFDPTRGLSVQKPLTNSPGVTVINIPRAGHCYDLNIPDNRYTQEVLAARQQELQLVNSWIVQHRTLLQSN